jgi:hypothetical protein
MWTDDVWVVDSTPVECARSRETVQRSDLAGWAEYGYCASASGGAAAPTPNPTPDSNGGPGEGGTASSQPCWEDLTCQRNDIATMSVDERQRMIQWIDDSDGDRKGYFNAILALLDFAGDKKLIQPGRLGQGSWFSSMDAVILEGIHDGFALSQGRNDAMYKDVRAGP